MTDEKKRKIAGLVYSLVTSAKSAGHTSGLKAGIDGTGWFNYGVNPEECTKNNERDTEECMNELFEALRLPEYREFNYTPDPNDPEQKE